MSRSDVEKTLSGVKAGDISTLESIYNENRIPFINFAKKYKLSEEDILDIFQDAIIALRDNIVNGTLTRLDSSVRTYLFSIGKYMIYKRKQNEEKVLRLMDSTNYQDDKIEGFVYFKEDVSKKQKLVNDGFKILGEKCQQLLKLFYYDGLTLKEIQRYLNYDNYNVVKSQKSRCLGTLKNLVNKQKNNG